MALKRKTPQDVLFNIFNVGFMLLLCFVCLWPFVYILMLSLSSTSLLQYGIVPRNPSFNSYIRVMQTDFVVIGFFNTVQRTVIGTLLTVFITICTAYPLSKRYFPNKSFWTGFIVFTMFFSGGLIPNYLLVRGLGLTNTVWAMVLPGLISSFNMLIMRNFFMSLPDALEESVKIDGGNDVLILFVIVVPLSKAIIATILLWTAVGHWNAWFDCLIYINDYKKHVMQLVLRRVVIEGTAKYMEMSNPVNETFRLSPENIKAATIMVTTLPILILYPFVQKYFVKGVMIGSLKG